MGRRREDLTGRTFERWTVLEYSGNDKAGQPVYLCRCSCGTKRLVEGCALKYGKSKSCGCLSIDRSKEENDLTGQTFGYLTVIASAGVDSDKHRLSLCRCKCGRECVVSNHNLKTGNTRSCGCLRADIDEQRSQKTDLIGQTIGNWTVLSVADNDKYGRRQYLCRCKCGTERAVYKYSLLRGASMSCGCMRGKRNDLIQEK